MSALFKTIETGSREEWLKARQQVLTATEIANLHVSGPAAYASIRESKLHPPREIHNQYLAWGHKREPHINDYVTALVDSRLKPNDQLLVSTTDPRIGATPDLLDDEVVGEDKTSKHPIPDMSPGLAIEDSLALRYYMQVQVQLFVTGADECVFTWEQHDDIWVNQGGEFLQPTPIRIDHQIVKPDLEAWRIMQKIVDKYFSEDDRLDEVTQAIITDKLEELRTIREQQDDLKQQETKLQDSIREQLGDRDASLKLPGATLSWFQPKSHTRFDTAAFKKAHPDLAGEFVKESAPRGRTLRITFKEDDV